MLFSEEELQEQSAIDYELTETVADCERCGLYKGCTHPQMGYTGEGRLKTLIVPEAPGKDEDAEGVQLVGLTGKFFENLLYEQFLDLHKDFWKINAVNCWPHDHLGNNKTPTDVQIDCCKSMVMETIYKLKPKHIILMGGVSFKSIFKDFFKGSRNANLTPTRWRGLHIPDQTLGCWIHTLFHPSYAIRNDHDLNFMKVYKSDLEAVKNYIQTDLKFPKFEYKDRVRLLYNIDEIEQLLLQILNDPPEFLAFDYETTGLKPYASGHSIVSISMCFDGKVSYSFPIGYRGFFTEREQERIINLLKKVLEYPEIGKQAHNMKYEHVWSKLIFDIDVHPWDWDSMIGAHIIDNRASYTGLKFQTYINYGIRPYDTEMNKYLEAPPKSQFNKIHDAPIEKLLRYGAYDSLFTFWLCRDQQNYMVEEEENCPESEMPIINAHEFLHEATIELAKVQMNGIPMSEEYYSIEIEKVENKVETLTEELLNSEEAKLFKERFGYEIGLSKNLDIAKLFYDILDNELRLTKKGSRSVDEETLKTFDSEFAEKLLRVRKLSKANSTYIKNYLSHLVNGKVYPSIEFNPVTYRSSYSDPNFQNIPKRDEELKAICRAGIVASPGNHLLEADFSGVEVGTGCTFHKDPNLINYVNDKSTDMHRDSAMDAFLLTEDLMTKPIRSWTKNKFVFPEFYGSYYAQCALDMYKIRREKLKNGVVLNDHLCDKGITNLEAFTEHLKEVERILWDERFPVYKQWKWDIQREFQSKGYLKTPLGFRYVGVMSQNALTNYQTQGTAFHILLWTLIQCNRLIKKKKLKSKILFQIHDSMGVDLYPPEKDLICNMIIEVGTKWTKQTFPWIPVNLEIEIEMAPIGGSWNDVVPMVFDERGRTWKMESK
jgi:uracil-DNA glycosylase family 4